MQSLLYAASAQVEKLRKIEFLQAEEESKKLPVITLQREQQPWKVIIEEDSVIIRGEKIERFAKRTDFESEDAVSRLRDIMRKMGIVKYFEKQAVEPGSKVYFGDNREDYLEY